MRKLRILLFVALLLSSLSCEKDNGENALLMNAIKSYNIALVQTYSDVNLNYMKPHATLDEINRLFPVIQSLSASGNRMVAIQKEFKVLDVRKKGDEAMVETSERWVYWWEDASTGMTTKQKKEAEYSIVYHLKKAGGRWKVDSLERKE